MEIRPEEVIQTTESPVELFYSALNNPATRQNYTNMLKKIMCEYLKPIIKVDATLVQQEQKKKKHYKRTFSDADFEIRVNEFAKNAQKDPKWAEAVLMTLVTKLMEKTKLPPTDPQHFKSVSVGNNLKPIKKLFDMNSVPMTWARIYSLISDENDITDKSRGYTIEEIQKILKHCTPMETVMVLLGACSGIRSGGFPLKWENIHPIYQVEDQYVWEPEEITESISEKYPIVCGMLKIYADSKEEYFAFVTPEWLDAVQIYKESWIKETNRIPRPEDPLFKRAGMLVRELKHDSIRTRMDRVINDSGIRKRLPGSKQKYNIPLFNGLRRFFNKQNKKSLSKNSKLASLILKETMMGHEGLIKLDKHYFKEHIDELIEEYIHSIPNLTIDDAARKQLELDKVNKEKSELEKREKEIDDLKENMDKIIDEKIGEYNQKFMKNLEKMYDEQILASEKRLDAMDRAFEKKLDEIDKS